MSDHYDAFISYSHDDEQLAARLSKRIQRYKAPKRTGLREKRLKVFRDVERLTASADLSEELSSRVQATEKFILLCSPSSSSSEYVNAEVHTYLEYQNLDSILFVLCRGELEEGLPPSLRAIDREPLFIDLRKADRKQFRLESLRLIAALLGVDYAELRREDEETRRKRRNGIIFAALTFLFFIASVFLIVTTKPEAWVRVSQPFLVQDLMPVHEFAVNRTDPSILLYKGHDARWGTNPRPEGYTMKPSRRIPDFESNALQHLKKHLSNQPIATVRFELKDRNGSGQVNIYGIFDWEKNELFYFRSLNFEGETKTGERKRLMIPPSLDSISDDPFDLSPWPIEILKGEGLIDDWAAFQGTIFDALSDKEIMVEFNQDYLDDGYDEWVEVWDPEHVVFSNVSSEELTINGDTLSSIENEDDLWDEIINSQEWVTYQKPELKELGDVYEGGEHEDVLKIVQAILNVTNQEALVRQLTPMLKRAEISYVILISSAARDVRADVLEISGIIDSPEMREGVPLQWLFRGSVSSPWFAVQLPLGKELTKVVDVNPLDREAKQALILTENKGFFRTGDGGKTWMEANFGEAGFGVGSQVKTIVAGSPPMIYSLVNRNKTFSEGENSLFRFKHRNWIERWQVGLIRILQ